MTDGIAKKTASRNTIVDRVFNRLGSVQLLGPQPPQPSMRAGEVYTCLPVCRAWLTHRHGSKLPAAQIGGGLDPMELPTEAAAASSSPPAGCPNTPSIHRRLIAAHVSNMHSNEETTGCTGHDQLQSRHLSAGRMQTGTDRSWVIRHDKS